VWSGAPIHLASALLAAAMASRLVNCFASTHSECVDTAEKYYHIVSGKASGDRSL
jgi:hypothetical protein